MGAEMAAFKKDTVLRSLMADSAFKSLYQVEIDDLRSKWKMAKQSINYSQAPVKQWLAIITNQYFEIVDLQNRMNGLLRKISIRSLGKEYDYLWNIKGIIARENKETDELAKRSLHGQRKILNYYFRRHWDDQFWMLVCGLIFGTWIFINFMRGDY